MPPCSSTVSFGCVALVIEDCSCCRLLKCQCTIWSRVGHKTWSCCVNGSCEGKGWKGVKELRWKRAGLRRLGLTGKAVG